MRKIKKFKIPVYSFDIMRKAHKEKIDIAGIGLGAECDFKEFISLLACALEPAVVFDYFPPDDKDLSVINAQKNPLTVCVLTLGKSFEDKIDSFKEEQEKNLCRIAAAVFMNTAIKTITDLASQEAIPEGFELLPASYIYCNPEPENIVSEQNIIPLYKDELLSYIHKNTSADKIGITIANGIISPKYTSIFTLAWVVKQKKKKNSK